MQLVKKELKQGHSKEVNRGKSYEESLWRLPVYHKIAVAAQVLKISKYISKCGYCSEVEATLNEKLKQLVLDRW